MHFGVRRTRISSSLTAAALLTAATASRLSLAVILMLMGCGSSPAVDTAAAGSGAGGHGDVTTGAAGGGAAGAVSNSPPFASKSLSTPPPGAYLMNESATGASAGPCATTPLGAFLAAIRAADPTLADIRAIYDPTTAKADGDFIYAYDAGAAGYDVVFKRGLGDCAAGCTENDYQYFAADSSCLPTKVGHYHAAWGTGTCLTVEGTPLWTHPTAPDPLTVCGTDDSAHDLRGGYLLSASGQRTACASNAAAAPVSRVVRLLIEQSPTALDAGFVTFSSTGDPLLDGVRLPARFQRWRFEAALPASSSTQTCPRAASITAHYDFEGYEPGSLDALEFGDETCGACKGSLSVALTAAATIQ